VAVHKQEYQSTVVSVLERGDEENVLLEKGVCKDTTP
jgi:hypothetical protein